ncbi:hypothetical protein DB347_20775 [Opitutaceae bacterium EW11]|nr:hypothetical protein DB347_20775 [Opitutaceae bacterium EW11]
MGTTTRHQTTSLILDRYHDATDVRAADDGRSPLILIGIADQILIVGTAEAPTAALLHQAASLAQRYEAAEVDLWCDYRAGLLDELAMLAGKLRVSLRCFDELEGAA